MLLLSKCWLWFRKEGRGGFRAWRVVERKGGRGPGTATRPASLRAVPDLMTLLQLIFFIALFFSSLSMSHPTHTLLSLYEHLTWEERAKQWPQRWSVWGPGVRGPQMFGGHLCGPYVLLLLLLPLPLTSPLLLVLLLCLKSKRLS